MALKTDCFFQAGIHAAVCCNSYRPVGPGALELHQDIGEIRHISSLIVVDPFRNELPHNQAILDLCKTSLFQGNINIVGKLLISRQHRSRSLRTVPENDDRDTDNRRQQK